MKKILLTGLALTCATMGFAQFYQGPVKKGDPYPGYNWNMKTDPSLAAKKTTGPKGVRKADSSLPSHWDTSEQSYFPTLVNQGGYGSCGVTSHVGHMMTSEMNAYQNTDGSLAVNQLTPMFEYPFTYFGPGKDEMALYVGFPTADIYGGQYESSIYGGSEYNHDDWGWVQGYDIFYNAMHHRIASAANFPEPTSTDAGRLAVKQYLYNHQGDPNFGGRGGTAGIGVGIGSSATAKVPQTTNNDNNGFTGKQYMKHWNLGGADHAMCLVGWDDRIEFDLDGNGTAGEQPNQFGQDEVGAWIIVNSWGSGYGNNGRIYCPYAIDGPLSTEKTWVKSEGDTIKYYVRKGTGWTPYVYHYRCGYEPQQTFKVTMQYSKRSEISVVAGMAQDTTATTPEKTFTFPYINYTGDGVNDGADAETPLLGKWADGKVHTEPMEFGIDITDLAANFDLSKPVKYFLIVNSKKTASGKGKILSASMIDYSLNASGNETTFPAKNTTINTEGKQTIITVTTQGNGVNAPANLAASDGTLTWTAPASGSFSPEKYYIYNEGVLTDSATTTSYTPSSTDGSFTVSAVYTIDGRTIESGKSNKADFSSPTYDTDILTMSNGDFWIPNIGTVHDKFTMEFWYKPSKLWNWGNYIFQPGSWGSKYLWHTSADGSISAGWANSTSTGDRIDAPASSLAVGTWAHIALVIDGSKQTLYVNGEQAATGTSTSHSGMPAFWANRIYVGGGNDSNKGNGMFGDMDELRFWSTARTADQIKNNMSQPIVNPVEEDGLLAYFKGDTYTKNGTTYLKDWAHGNDATFDCASANVTQSTLATGTTLKQEITPEVSIVAPTACTVGETITPSYKGSVSIVSNAWTATGATPTSASALYPSFCFTKAGTQTISLTSTNIDGLTATATATITVTSVTPSAYFTASADTVKGTARVSFVSVNKAKGCTYAWSMPGAETETATTRDASAVYDTAGEKTITLTITDADGQTYSYEKTIVVAEDVPGISYTISPKVVVKGHTVTLTDQSSYNPNRWAWSLKSDNAFMNFNQQTGTITPTVAGVYNLNYLVSNDLGESTTSEDRALFVCNSASKTGLAFYDTSGNQNMTTTLRQTLGSAWTLDFWMNPTELSASSNGFSLKSSSSAMNFVSSSNGSVTVTCGTKTATVSNFFVKNQWHHYAITDASGTLTFYRDCQKIGTASVDGSDFTSLVFDSSDAPIIGTIDELRVWGSTLSQSVLNAVAMDKLTDNQVTSYKSSKSLLHYYHFDQDAGDAQDAANSNTANGKLTNFSQTVAYYAPSDGVFCLDFSDPSNETLKGDLLTQSHFKPVSVSDQETTGETAPVSKAFDGDKKTFWHSQYNSLHGYPHSVTVERTQSDIVQSVQVSYPPARSIAYYSNDVTFEESDDSVNWTTLDYHHGQFHLVDQNYVLANPSTKRYLRMTFNTPLNGSSSWLTVGEFNFYGKAATALTLDEDNDNIIWKFSSFPAVLKRTFSKDSWNTLVLPFSLTADQAKTAFGDGIKVATYKDATCTSGNSYTLNFTEQASAAIPANQPVLIYGITTGVGEKTEYSFDAVSVTDLATCTQTADGFNFIGTFKPMTLNVNDWFIASNNKLYYASKAFQMKGLRAVFRATDDNSSAKIGTFDVTNGTTGIRKVYDENGKLLRSGVTYNLSGQKVNSSYRGIVISNGKKYLQK